jgi:hypothetical protein
MPFGTWRRLATGASNEQRDAVTTGSLRHTQYVEKSPVLSTVSIRQTSPSPCSWSCASVMVMSRIRAPPVMTT